MSKTTKPKKGRPRGYNWDNEKEVEKFRKKVEEYFEMVERQGTKVASIIRLCEYLGITRETLNQYRKKKAFSDIIKKADDLVEVDMVEKSTLGIYNPTITIFRLKNKYGWRDKPVEENKEMAENISKSLAELINNPVEERKNE